MSIEIPHPTLGYVPSDLEQLERDLQVADDLLFVQVGIIKHPVLGEGRRIEVWRACEDGRNRMVAHFRMEERGKVAAEVAALRVESPGHVDTLTKVEAANEATDKARADAFVDAAMTPMDHLARLQHDRNNPNVTFRQVGGMRDEKKVEATTDA